MGIEATLKEFDGTTSGYVNDIYDVPIENLTYPADPWKDVPEDAPYFPMFTYSRNIGHIDLLPSDLNNNKPSIDYCVLSDDIIRSAHRYNGKVFKYGGSSKGKTHKEILEELHECQFAIVKAGLIAYEAVASSCQTFVYGTNKWEWMRACELVDKDLARFYIPNEDLYEFYQDGAGFKDGSYKIIKNILKYM